MSDFERQMIGRERRQKRGRIESGARRLRSNAGEPAVEQALRRLANERRRKSIDVQICQLRQFDSF